MRDVEGLGADRLVEVQPVGKRAEQGLDRGPVFDRGLHRGRDAARADAALERAVDDDERAVAAARSHCGELHGGYSAALAAARSVRQELT